MKNLNVLMKLRSVFLSVFTLFFFFTNCSGQPGNYRHPSEHKGSVKTGAERFDLYVPKLQGKNVALIVNQTSIVGERHLLDVLLDKKVQVVKVFVPEHGFRGTADAGAHVGNSKDKRTGLPVISLYGNNKKPKKDQLEDIDVLIYDLQDVGVRFYTYISTLEYAMEACAENGKEFIVLDRPNPNGHYIDGPVLEPGFRSFVGMQCIPVVYGMTACEYAGMLRGEKLFNGAEKLKLTVISCDNYDHKTRYTLPVAPSPNLKNMAAIYLYPSLCLFEGTPVSVGRGTDKPFQQWGHPDLKARSDYSFTPHSTTGASRPLYEGEACYGMLLAETAEEALQKNKNEFNLDWLLLAYEWYPDKSRFFNSNNFFDKLAGTDKLRKQISRGMSGDAIRRSWANDLAAFRNIRKKYLLYPDFE